MKRTLVFSCEHGGREVPAEHRALLRGARRALETHRGWDEGALVLAKELARAFHAPLLACTTTRLLVDANRSRGHPRLFSEWSRALSREAREAVLERWWLPHRTAVEGFVRAHRRVLHVSIHSFTPVWHGRRRDVDVGFLYDPARDEERDLVTAWLRALRARCPALRLRRNHPYRGTADGLPTELRRRFPACRYAVLEIEVCQRFPRGASTPWRRLREALVVSLADALARFSEGRVRL